MKFSDETLMAFADGELDEPARSEVEQALRADPALAARVAGHKALRANVSDAFAGVLDEPVPARLQRGAPAPATVVRLDAARAARQQVQQQGHEQQARPPRQAPPVQAERARPSWPRWGALAASLVIGVFAGSLGLKSMQGEPQLAERGGTLVAQGKLEHALSQRLASAAAPAGEAQIGITFVDKGGAYCRSFTLGTRAGLACRAGAEWQVALLAESAAPGPGAYRQAASSLPSALLDAIDARIAGAALDAQAERAALRSGWQSAPAPPPR